MAAYLLPADALTPPSLVFIAVDDGYTFDELHDSGDDIPAEAVLATSKVQTGLTVTNGVLDLADQDDAFDGGSVSGATALILCAGWEDALEPIAYLDTWDGTESPLATPRGVHFRWNAAGLFKLGGASA